MAIRDDDPLWRRIFLNEILRVVIVIIQGRGGYIRERTDSDE